MNDGILYYKWVNWCEFALLHRGQVFSGMVDFKDEKIIVENNQSLMDDINNGLLWRTIPMDGNSFGMMVDCIELQMILHWILDDAFVNIPLEWYRGVHSYYGNDPSSFDRRVFRYRGIPWWEYKLGKPSFTHICSEDCFEKDILYYGIGDADMGTMMVENAKGYLERVPCRYFVV